MLWNRISFSTVRARSIIAVTLLIGLASAAVAQVPPPSTTGSVPDGSPALAPLTTLGDAFRAAYRHAKEVALAHSGPVILLEGDNVVLKKGAQRTEVRYTPAIYHVLKAVSHVPLALDVMMSAYAGEEPLGDQFLGELREYRGLVVAAEARLGSYGLDPEQVERQRKIVEASLKFLDSVVEARRCTNEERVAFARRMTPTVRFNVHESARAELDSLHRQVCAWRSEMSPAEWNALTVVILGSPQPRKESLGVQYFARLLGQPGEGPRIIFAESIRDETKALDLMAAKAVDIGIGVDFFNDPVRMSRDLLADAAKEYLPILIDRP